MVKQRSTCLAPHLLMAPNDKKPAEKYSVEKYPEKDKDSDDLMDPARTPIVQQWFSRQPPTAEDEYFERRDLFHEHEVKDPGPERPRLRVVPNESSKSDPNETTSDEQEGGLWLRFQQWLSRVLSKGPGDQWRP
jgi:hypothetical protein